MPEALERIRRASRRCCRTTSTSRSTAESARGTSPRCARPARTCSSPGSAVFGERGRGRRPTAAWPTRSREPSHHLERALELAERGRGTTRPEPDRRRGRRRERRGRRRGLARARGRAARGDRRARGGGRARPRRDALRHARAVRARGAHAAVRRRRRRGGGAARGLRGRRSEPEDGRARLRAPARRRASTSRSPTDDLAVRARRQNEAFRVWIAEGRPFVTYKAAMTAGRAPGGVGRRRALDLGRGEPAPRARAPGRVGRGRGRHGHRARGRTRGSTRATSTPSGSRGASRSGSGPLPAGSELELVSGPLEEALGRLAAEGVQSLLLEGGPTLAGAFLRAGALDKLVLFVAPARRRRGRCAAALRRPGRADALGRPLAELARGRESRRGRAPDGLRARAVRPARVWLGPDAHPLLAEAIERAGGSLVEADAANAIAWHGWPPGGIREVLHPGIEWVQLDLTGVERWLEEGLVDGAQDLDDRPGRLRARRGRPRAGVRPRRGQEAARGGATRLVGAARRRPARGADGRVRGRRRDRARVDSPAATARRPDPRADPLRAGGRRGGAHVRPRGARRPPGAERLRRPRSPAHAGDARSDRRAPSSSSSAPTAGS